MDAELHGTEHGRNQLRAAEAAPHANVRVMSLEIVDDDLGGDPYNRTGQFCVPELKDLD